MNGVATFIGMVGLTVAAAVLVVLLARQEDSLFSVCLQYFQILIKCAGNFSDTLLDIQKTLMDQFNL